MAGKKKAAMPLGSGGRFKAIEQKVAQEKGYSAKEAAAVAASIGRKKYGSKKMAQLSQQGRKKG